MNGYNAFSVVSYARELLATGNTDKVVCDRAALSKLTRLAKTTREYTKAARIAHSLKATPAPSQAQDGYGAPTGAECARCRELDAHLHAIRSVDGSCPQCADTKRECANIIAEFEVERRAAECTQGNPND